jgi:aryl-alcohol dehydrogenase-like predicted oxidoreductase
MRRHLIPRTNLDASVLCLGTAEFGSVVEDSVSEAIIDCYIDAGGNVLDTAEVYAEWVPGGSHRSEEFLGYLLGQAFPVLPIVGSKRVTDLEESLHAAEVTLSPNQVDFLAANT